MPQMSGIEVSKKIRETDPHIVIIGLSANATTKAIQESINAGMNDYLTKPIQFNKLVHSIASHINLPYKVIKRDFLREEKLLSRLEGMAKDRADFTSTTKGLVVDIDNQINLIKNGDYSYETVHSLLNKVIYIGDENLIGETRDIQEFSVEKRNSKIKDALIDLISDWDGLKKQISIILKVDEN
jgi:CheY-like chemotaxis protein